MDNYKNMPTNNEGFSTHNNNIHLVRKTRCERLRDWCSHCKNNHPVCVGILGGLFIGLIIGAMAAPNHCDDNSSVGPAPAPGMNIVKNSSNIRGASALRVGSPPCHMNGKMYNGTCYCDSGYIGATCDYKQKKQVVAFCLEFFIGPFGSGFFYMGLYKLAIGQLMTTLSGPILICFIACLCNKEDNDPGYMQCFELLWKLAWIVYWLTGVILIGQNKLNDGDNKPLEGW